MVAVQKQNSMAFKMKSSIAKLTNTTTDHNKKLREQYEKDLAAYNDSITAYNRELRINELLRDPRGYDYSKDSKEAVDIHQRGYTLNNKVLDEYRSLRNMNENLGIYDDRNRREIETLWTDARVSDVDTSFGSKFRGDRRKPGDPLVTEDPLGEYQLPSRQMIANKMQPTPPDRPNYRENQKLVMMKSKNLEFIPTQEPEIKLKKALPAELATDSEYFTVTSKYHHSGNKYILKDSAGREIDRVTKEEYQEKYGDVLQRGTKKYGKENLQRRLYIKN